MLNNIVRGVPIFGEIFLKNENVLDGKEDSDSDTARVCLNNDKTDINFTPRAFRL
jgi:hypothetical protein